MAKLPKVKCKYCDIAFYREDEEHVKVKNRYAHQSCHEKAMASQTKEDKDKEELFEYLKILFNGKYNFIVVNRMLDKYINEYHYTYSGIHKTLIYFYEVKKNPIDKANGSIGIVPYAYDEAKKYYKELADIEKKNAGKRENVLQAVARTIRIPSPQIEKKKRKLFKFLDEGED